MIKHHPHSRAERLAIKKIKDVKVKQGRPGSRKHEQEEATEKELTDGIRRYLSEEDQEI